MQLGWASLGISNWNGEPKWGVSQPKVSKNQVMDAVDRWVSVPKWINGAFKLLDSSRLGNFTKQCVASELFLSATWAGSLCRLTWVPECREPTVRWMEVTACPFQLLQQSAWSPRLKQTGYGEVGSWSPCEWSPSSQKQWFQRPIHRHCVTFIFYVAYGLAKKVAYGFAQKRYIHTRCTKFHFEHGKWWSTCAFSTI